MESIICVIERGYSSIDVRSLGKHFNDNSLVTTLSGYLDRLVLKEKGRELGSKTNKMRLFE
jgi:hypothetical protein